MSVTRARELRRSMSPPEAILWRALRARPGGFKFRRQHPVGLYVLDFFCRSAMVAIEVDGQAHDMGDNPSRDERRDRSLAEQGVLTLRFLAADVMKDAELVVRHVVATCDARTTRTSPAVAGEGDRPKGGGGEISS